MILKLLKPNQYLSTYKDIDLLNLKLIGIKVIILDIDNTLVESKEYELSEDAIRFVKQIKSAKIIPVIISNNIESRVKVFSNLLNVDYYSFALKPTKKAYKLIMKKYDVKSDEVAVVGDQIITDVLGGNRMNMHTILIKPISEKSNVFEAINRIAENRIFKYLEYKDILQRGKYYDNM